MILGVNGIRLVRDRSGVARCIEAFLRNLDRLEHPFTEVRVYSPLRLGPDIVLPGCGRNVVLPSRLPPGLWEQITLPRGHGRAGVLFCPSYIQPLFPGCLTLTVHHGSYEGYPQAFDWWTLNKARVMYAASAWRATVITTVSEYSRRDMARFYRIPPERVQVIPEGVDTDLFRPESDGARLARWRMERLGGDEPFIAYVGKPTERRNLSDLLRAYARLRTEDRIPHRFVIAGAALPGTSPFRTVVEELGIGDDVSVIGHLSHDELPLLYNASAMLVYPSSYEGFGMPVLEAMACGTPVIALDNTAFPEFAGGVALLLPDARVSTLADGIRRVLGDDALRAQMAMDGPVRAARYDWRIVSQRYLDLLIALAHGRKGVR